MVWLLSLARKARKVPLAGWLLAALVFLLILCWHFARRAYIMSQRVIVQRKISSARRRHEQVMRGQDDKLADIKDTIDEMRTGRIAALEEREAEIRERSFNLDSTASLANEVFSK
jgi:hypothetical protein